MGVWGQRPQPPQAGGLGAKPSAAGGQWGFGDGAPIAQVLHFFAKITSF